MKLKWIAALALLPTLALAQATATDCATARDPERCEARQAALKACADKRGPAKRACLEASLPPVDCSKASDPAKCEAAQKARDVCKAKTGKDLKKCLAEDKPKKKRQRRKPAAN